MNLETTNHLENIRKAAANLDGVLRKTELIYSDFFSKETGNRIYIKPENLQRTGSFKIRGAYNKVANLTAEERAKGIIASSAGNHAQGVALAASKMGIKATIVMPLVTPLIKVDSTKSYGADVVLHGNIYAVSSTIHGLFPPSSNVTEVRCSAAARIIYLPTLGLPTKKIWSKSSFNNAWLTSGPPVKILI